MTNKRITVEFRSDDFIILLNCINHSYSASQLEAEYEVRAGGTVEIVEDLRLRIKEKSRQLEKKIME